MLWMADLQILTAFYFTGSSERANLSKTYTHSKHFCSLYLLYTANFNQATLLPLYIFCS
jgi:hypothetical protein